MPLLETFNVQRHDAIGDQRRRKYMRAVLMSIKELGLTHPEQISIAYSSKLVTETEHRAGAIVIIRGLFVREERTKEVKDKACAAIRDVLKQDGFENYFIEVWTESTDTSKEGFADWKPGE